MEEEEIRTELREIKNAMSFLSGNIQALLVETKNQSKIKNNHEERIHDVEMSYISKIDFQRMMTKFDNLDGRMDAVENNMSVNSSKTGTINSTAVFLANGALLILCALLSRIF